MATQPPTKPVPPETFQAEYIMSMALPEAPQSAHDQMKYIEHEAQITLGIRVLSQVILENKKVGSIHTKPLDPYSFAAAALARGYIDAALKRIKKKEEFDALRDFRDTASAYLDSLSVSSQGAPLSFTRGR